LVKSMKLVVFTDLDETLLDGRTYEWKAASEALEELRSRDAAIILVSSKTFAEMAPIYRALALRTPFVLENGGGIVLTPDSPVNSHLPHAVLSAQMKIGDWILLPLGLTYEHIVHAMESISSETGILLRGFSSMSDEEVAGLTGLDLSSARNARLRHFDEPFVIVEPTEEKEHRIRQAAVKRELTCAQGGRFWHLMGHEGKAKAVSVLIEAYRRAYGAIHTIGLGDGPNDFPFLALVDTAFLLGGSRCRFAVTDEMKKARGNHRIGPEGWNEAVLSFLSELDG
jgi:mannosyl-3-phosphoglycerate phosphatase